MRCVSWKAWWHMKAEQRASSVYRLGDSVPSFHIETTIELEVPGEGDSDVTTYLAYPSKYPARLQEQLKEAIYRGVHEGIAMAELPLSPGGMTVRIARLRLSPAPDSATPLSAIQGLIGVVQTLTADTVRSLWTGLAALAAKQSA